VRDEDRQTECITRAPDSAAALMSTEIRDALGGASVSVLPNISSDWSFSAPDRSYLSQSGATLEGRSGQQCRVSEEGPLDRVARAAAPSDGKNYRTTCEQLLKVWSRESAAKQGNHVLALGLRQHVDATLT